MMYLEFGNRMFLLAIMKKTDPKRNGCPKNDLNNKLPQNTLMVDLISQWKNTVEPKNDRISKFYKSPITAPSKDRVSKINITTMWK